MKRKFIINIVFLVAISIIVKAFWVLGIDRSVQNIAGEEEYGFYFSLFSFSVLFTLLLDLGIAGFNNRAVSSDPSKVKLYFGNILVIRLSAAVVYFIFTLLAAWIMNYSGRQISILVILMLNQIIASITAWLRSNISGMQHFFIDSILSVADRLVMIILCSLLLWGGVTSTPFRIEWFVYSQTAAYLFVMLISFAIVVRIGHIGGLNFSTRVMSDIIKAGVPFALVALFMTLYWRMDTVMLERLLPDGKMQAGAYAQSFRLFDACAMIPVMFGGMLLPVFSREISSDHDLKPIVSIASKMLITPLGIIVAALVVWPGEVLDMLYTSPVEDSVNSFRLLMIAILPVSLIYIYSTILTAGGKMTLLAAITGTAMVINFGMNALLIPKLTITGSAISALVTQTIVAVGCLIMVNRKMFRLKMARRTLQFMGMLLVTLLTGLICRMLETSWVLGMALQMGIGILWALCFRMVEPLKAIRLISEKP